MTNILKVLFVGENSQKKPIRLLYIKKKENLKFQNPTQDH